MSHKAEIVYYLTLKKKSQDVQSLWKIVWRFLKILKVELPYDPAISLLGIHAKEFKAGS